MRLPNQHQLNVYYNFSRGKQQVIFRFAAIDVRSKSYQVATVCQLRIVHRFTFTVFADPDETPSLHQVSVGAAIVVNRCRLQTNVWCFIFPRVRAGAPSRFRFPLVTFQRAPRQRLRPLCARLSARGIVQGRRPMIHIDFSPVSSLAAHSELGSIRRLIRLRYDRDIASAR